MTKRKEPRRRDAPAAAEKTRCAWAGTDPLYIAYHDTEWGVPLHDDRALFEMLTLEGAQAGLSWITILRKRDNYRKAFHQFDPERIARYTSRDVARLLADAGIVRNRLKIEAAIGNARAFLRVLESGASFDDYLWSFTDGRAIEGGPRSMRDVPVRTAESDAMSRQLARDGFRFVGSTICYAFMQAVGMVNDHLAGCFRYREVGRATRGGRRLIATGSAARTS